MTRSACAAELIFIFGVFDVHSSYKILIFVDESFMILHLTLYLNAVRDTAECVVFRLSKFLDFICCLSRRGECYKI